MTVARRTVTIVNEKGLHARASRLFVTTAEGFDAAVTVSAGGQRVTADSVLFLLELGAGPGEEIEIVADGSDAEAAADTLAALVTAGFHEEDDPKG